MMATKTSIRLRGPVLAPTSQVILTQQHSFELMKTVITATISHVLWARRIFPNITYNLRSYDPADPDVSYDAFIEGTKGPPISFEASENLMIWKILPRSQDPAVDKILDCLEIGAADALKRGYLAKLQVSFHSIDEKSITDSNLIESYTMVFEYDDEEGLKISSEIDMKSMVVRSAKQDLYGLVNDVGFLIHHSNRHRSSDTELPAQFRMFLSLKYNETAPENYQPPMFSPGDDNTSRVLRSGVPNANLKMKTRFHSVSVGIHIIEQENSTLQNQPLTRGADEKASNKVSSNLTQPMALRTSQPEAVNTQPDAVKQLQMIGISRNPNSDTQDTVTLDSNPKSPKTRVPLSVEGIKKCDFPSYTQPILDHMKSVQAREKNLDLTPKALKCECNVAMHNETLFDCDICSNMKHARCYGYLDETLPTEIVCYTCLLGNDEKERLELKIKPLIIKRRALYYLRVKKTLSSSSELSPQLNIPKYKITRLLGDLKAEGFLKGSRKDKKITPMATYIGDDEKLHRLYFRPQQEIDHLFVMSNSLVPGTDDSGNKDPCNLILEAQKLHDPTQVETSKLIRYSSVVGPLLTNRLNQHHVHINHDMEIYAKPANLTQNMPQTYSPMTSSTQGTPSPDSALASSTYQEQDNLDQNKFDHVLRKRSYAVTGANLITVAEETKRSRTSKTSPWLIRNH